MWQEDFTQLVRSATGQERLALARVPADKGADWGAVPLTTTGGAIPAALLHLPEIAAGATDGDRWLLTLTDRARGQVVPSLLCSDALPPAAPLPSHALPTDRLYAVRLAHARTHMLVRQAQQHGLLPESAVAHMLVQTWARSDLPVLNGPAERRVLLALAASRLARRRARAQGRPAPIVASLRDIGAAFAPWFAATRFTPRAGRGTAPGTPGDIMDSYRLRLALATAVGSALRAGLTDLALDAPENL